MTRMASMILFATLAIGLAIPVHATGAGPLVAKAPQRRWMRGTHRRQSSNAQTRKT